MCKGICIYVCIYIYTMNNIYAFTVCVGVRVFGYIYIYIVKVPECIFIFSLFVPHCFCGYIWRHLYVMLRYIYMDM